MGCGGLASAAAIDIFYNFLSSSKIFVIPKLAKLATTPSKSHFLQYYLFFWFVGKCYALSNVLPRFTFGDTGGNASASSMYDFLRHMQLWNAHPNFVFHSNTEYLLGVGTA